MIKQMRRWMALPVLIALTVPSLSWAQCQFTATYAYVSVGNPHVRFGFRHPDYPMGQCILTHMSGDVTCQSDLGDMTAPYFVSLTAIGMSMDGPQRCAWLCNCGGSPQTFVADNSNGLPVELLEFSVDADDQ